MFYLYRDNNSPKRTPNCVKDASLGIKFVNTQKKKKIKNDPRRHLKNMRSRISLTPQPHAVLYNC